MGDSEMRSFAFAPWLFLRRADLRSGERILINGAGGTIGVLAIQLAKYFGAEVTAVDSAAKPDMLLGIGADHVIDFAKTAKSRLSSTGFIRCRSSPKRTLS